MTTMLDPLPAPDTDSVARRLRRFMGEFKISRKALAAATQIPRSTLVTRLDNHSAFALDEIGVIAHALNRSWLWVLTGRDDGFRPDPGIPDGTLLLPRMDSNHQPCDSVRPGRAAGWVLRKSA